MRKNIAALFALTSAILIGCDPAHKIIDETTANTAHISQADIGRRIEILASDEFEGRSPSTPGGQKASQYIADEMKSAGLAPAGKDGTYFQPVILTETQLLSSSAMGLSKNGAVFHQSDQNTNSVYWSKRPDTVISLSLIHI